MSLFKGSSLDQRQRLRFSSVVLGLNLGHLVVDDVEAEDAEGADLVLASAAGKPVVLAAHDPGKGVAHRISPALLL